MKKILLGVSLSLALFLFTPSANASLPDVKHGTVLQCSETQSVKLFQNAGSIFGYVHYVDCVRKGIVRTLWEMQKSR